MAMRLATKASCGTLPVTSSNPSAAVTRQTSVSFDSLLLRLMLRASRMVSPAAKRDDCSACGGTILQLRRLMVGVPL